MFRQLWVVVLCVVAVAAQAEDTLRVVVQPKENLITISQRYLKQPSFQYWPEIARLNHLSEPYTIFPGTTLRLPLRLMAAQSAAAKWLVVTGDVRVISGTATQGAVAVVGGALMEGERVVVPQDASALLELADGSQVKLLSNTEFVMDEHRYYRGRAVDSSATSFSSTKAFVGLLRLIQGSVETRATPATDRAKPLRIQTPTAVVGVRGTEFRVTHAAAPAQDDLVAGVATHAEVDHGLVLAQLDEVRKVQIPGGFGVKLDPNVKQSPTVVPLLEAPDIAGWPLKQDKLTLEFPAMPKVQAGREVVAYLIELALDSAMTHVVYDHYFASGKPERIPNLADGTWYMTVRDVDGQGIEGKDAKATVVLKARPQPPFIQTPKPREKLVQGQDVKLSWASFNGATSYLVETLDEKQKRAEYTTKEAAFLLKDLTIGHYSWRIATQITTPQGLLDTGPWSGSQDFTIVATPEPAQGKLDEDGKALNLRWEDQKAKAYEVQLAREPSFDLAKAPVLLKTTSQPELSIANPEPGQYFIRYRAIEEDGFVSGWSGTMRIDIPTNWLPLWLFLGSLAIMGL